MPFQISTESVGTVRPPSHQSAEVFVLDGRPHSLRDLGLGEQCLGGLVLRHPYNHRVVHLPLGRPLSAAAAAAATGQS